MFLIPIRHKATGEEKNFFGPQEIANFLASQADAECWTGWEFLGALPAAEATSEEPAPTGIDASGQQPATEGDPVPATEDVHAAANESLIAKMEHAVLDAIHEVLPTGE